MAQRSFGQMVREARLERHLSMGQLAAVVDRSTASVRRWERDEGLPSEDAIETLIVRLGLDRADVERALVQHRGEDREAAVVGEGDPIDVVPLADVAMAVGAGAFGDAESPAPQATPVQPRTVAPPAPTWPTASVPVAVATQEQSLLRTIRDPDGPWLGYIRAALTIAVFAGLGWILLWAVPEFMDALDEVWDSLWQGEGV